ncbi:MAG: phosphatidate cytidylyltransferase [Lachnospiraceae bacterium]|nr:phosphatidate cytidylyltransferase [Lachnospiraceae bacterium]
MFIERLISGIILLLIAAFALVMGGNVLYGILFVISLIGIYEYGKAVNIQNTALFGVGCAGAVLYMLSVMFFDEFSFETLMLTLFGMFFAYVILYPKYRIEQVSLAYLGVIYVPVMLFFMYLTRIMTHGEWLVWLIFISAWGSDTFAYVVGMLIGRHKLPSKLSPKKSIEGCVGGVVGAALLGVIYGIVMTKYVNGFVDAPVIFGVAGAIGSVISQFGDLTASAIKRNFDIKDYGKLIPGHGGILDRFDSIIFTAPIVYVIIKIYVYFGGTI